MEVVWDEERSLWRGATMLGPDSRVGVAVVPGPGDRDTALAYARFALAHIGPRVPQARDYAASELLGYYNYLQAHLPAGEPLTAEEFAGRLRLEAIRFGREGRARLYFGHDLSQGRSLYDGGLVVVEATVEGEFRRAYWVTEPDAREIRATISCG